MMTTNAYQAITCSILSHLLVQKLVDCICCVILIYLVFMLVWFACLYAVPVSSKSIDTILLKLEVGIMCGNLWDGFSNSWLMCVKNIVIFTVRAILFRKLNLPVG